jgi:hypothetical protein
MKTSKIILLSFSGIIILFLLSLLIEKKKPAQKPVSFHLLFEKEALPNVKYLRILDSGQINLCSGESDTIQIAYENGKKHKMDLYHVVGDTLVIDKVSHTDKIHIYLTLRGIQQVELQRSNLNVQHYHANQLVVLSDSSIVHVLNCSIDSLLITLGGRSHFIHDNKKLEKVVVDADNSRCEIRSETMKELKADLRTRSELYTGKVLICDVNADSTSRFYSN